jgi:hypothetical protein
MTHKSLSRRHFLQTSIGAPTLAALAVGSTAAAAETSAKSAKRQNSQVSTLKQLNKQQAVKISAMSRTLFPHDLLDDVVYMKVVHAIDAEMGANSSKKKLVFEGLALLGDDFLVSNPRNREQQLRKIEGSDFFKYVHAQTINHIYGNPELWPVFGFEGSSLERGGYLDRGFDDIDWLPSA